MARRRGGGNRTRQAARSLVYRRIPGLPDVDSRSRRAFLARVAAWPCLAGCAQGGARSGAPRVAAAEAYRRWRPGDPAWPDAAAWAALAAQVGGRLVKISPTLDACNRDPRGPACSELFKAMKNPYFIGDDLSLTQTTGWVDAWTSMPSAYAVAARNAADVAATVDFARERRLRLVVKGGGHSYLGTSSSADSLLVWTRPMRDIVIHREFVARDCDGPAVPAVSVGSGALWMQTYDEVTTRGQRYVQGGGCATVGVAGLVQGGGFGSYSKRYGTAAASLLEVEVVTADGVVRTANAKRDPDLFWALKGGGGGTFGVVTRMTLRTHELPPFFGWVSASVQAASDEAFRALLGDFLALCADRLVDVHWGEIVNVRPDRTLDIQLSFQGLTAAEADAIWQPFFAKVRGASPSLRFSEPPRVRQIAATHRWDPAFFRRYGAGAVRFDDRPGASPDRMYWSANVSEAGHFIHGFESVWLPTSLLDPGARPRLLDALVAASRHSTVEIHLQKGLAGAPDEVVAAARETATNPAVLDAFALAICGSEGPPAFAGIAGHEPDLGQARRNAEAVARAMRELRKAVPAPGSYVAESSFFEADWQRCYWGPNYKRLLEIKKRYDPAGVFFVRHGVGSESWSDDGFVRLAT
jgi:FAD/FMN-containing dehydrogenase